MTGAHHHHHRDYDIVRRLGRNASKTTHGTLHAGGRVVGARKGNGEKWGGTYNQTSRALAVNLVSDLDGPATAFGCLNMALFGGLERPYGVVVLGMQEQLVDGQGRHGQRGDNEVCSC